MITVFQSAPAQQPLWQSQCLSSVREWCAQQGYRYQFLGDELFDRVPNALRNKLAGRTPIIADLARLSLLRDYLESEGGTALWLDADTLVVDASWAPNTEASVCFGEEYWLDTDSRGRLKVFKQPHNAFMLFAANNTVLPFLHQVAHSIIERADSAAISPQMIGPKLLKALHSLADFPLCPEAGALSPMLASELVHGCGPAIDAVRKSHRPKTCLWNLCGSLAGEERHESNLLALTHDLSLFGSLT
jgi:hypothetical protein